MQSEKKLSAIIKAAMRKKKLSMEQLARALNTNMLMVNRIVCGKVVPSRHLQKQMVEILGIPEIRVRNATQRRTSPAKRPSIRAKAA